MTNQTVVVEQVDRDAAAALTVAVGHVGSAFTAHITEGLEDDTSLVQAFARHRLAERERCAKVADASAAKCVPLMNGLGVSASMERGRHTEATEIATAIRAGDPA